MGRMMKARGTRNNTSVFIFLVEGLVRDVFLKEIYVKQGNCFVMCIVSQRYWFELSTPGARRLNELNKQSVIIDNVLINASHFSVNGKLKVELSPLFTNCPYRL